MITRYCNDWEQICSVVSPTLTLMYYINIWDTHGNEIDMQSNTRYIH